MNRPPAPATANLNRAPVKAPADPLLDFLLEEDPVPAAPTSRPADPAPVAVPQPRPVEVKPEEEPNIPLLINRVKSTPPAQPILITTRNPDNFVPVGLRLTGINGKACTINDRTYYAGDRVDNYIVQKVSEDSVTLRTGRTLIELKLEE